MDQEWQTRENRIDRRLTNQGWQLMPWIHGLSVAPFSGVAVSEFPTANGPADCALFVDACLLGSLEAEEVAVNLPNVLAQARRYAEAAFHGAGNWNGLRAPRPIRSLRPHRQAGGEF